MKNQDKHIYINVFLPKRNFVPAGVITFNENLGYSSFSYFPSYMEEDLPPLNPSTLNWRENNQRHFIVDNKQNNQMLDRTFWEMLPTQNDWGHQVLSKRYPEYDSFNNAQKLFFLERRIVGGLESYTKEKANEENIVGEDWLDKIRDESIDFYLKRVEQISQIKAINPLTIYGGVRPKCMFQDEDGNFWIAKFNLPNDPYDMAIAEQVAMDMARDMGLSCAETKVLQLPSGENVFLSKRFDRKGEKRFHSLSLFALAPGNGMVKNPLVPGNPGSFIQRLVQRYSDFESMDVVNVVTKLLLDVGVNNTDNHLRNLRIILNENNKWELSPMYDIVFNPFSQNHVYNPANLSLDQLYLTNPNFADSMAKELGVSPDIIYTQLNKVVSVTEKWEEYCDKYGMSAKDKLKIGNAISLGTYRKELTKKLSNENEQKLKSYPKLRPKD